jgi:hypothetical protein
MTLPTIDQARSWRGLTLVATDNKPVGKIEAIYVDRASRQPEWALVDTGLFGTAWTFVPLADAAQQGDTVRVPHELPVVREAPRLEKDAELSEEDEARLYAHYGISYTTAASPSGLPASEESGSGAAAGGTDAAATARTSRFEADTPAAAGEPVTTGAAPSTQATGTLPPSGQPSWLTEPERPTSKAKPAAAAGLGALVLAAAGAALARLRSKRQQRPPSLGDRVGQVGRGAADTLARTAGSVRRQTGTDSKAAAGAAKQRRKAARKAAAGGLAAAWNARKAARTAGDEGRATVSGGRRAARKAARKASEGRATVGGGRTAARKAGEQAAAAVASTKATMESKRRARKRARSRRRAAETTAGVAKSVASFPTSGGRRMQRLVSPRKRAPQVTPRRRRRSKKMKVMGKLGMAVGGAIGYVLGTKAGRERYEQITASARQLLEKPQVKRVVESAPGNLGARVEQVAHRAADRVQQAGERVAASGSTSGTTSTTTTTPSTPTIPTPSVPSTPGPSVSGSTTTTAPTTPTVPTPPGGGDATGSPRGGTSGTGGSSSTTPAGGTTGTAGAPPGGAGTTTDTGTGTGTGTTKRSGSSTSERGKPKTS